MRPAELYSSEFYRALDDATLRSAKAVVPHIMSLINPTSVIDIGCGTGTWLSVFRELGVENVTGVDGAYVPRTELLIPKNRFLAIDLAAPWDISGRYDLALSLEVAEHLPPEVAEAFVQSLVSLAPVVVFSAAIPHQGGTEHINEQWQSYCVRLFRQAGYLASDVLRGRLWLNDEIAYYYAQNIFVFSSGEALARLSDVAAHSPPSEPVDIVHPTKWRITHHLLATEPELLVGNRSLVSRVPHAIVSAIGVRLRRLLRRQFPKTE